MACEPETLKDSVSARTPDAAPARALVTGARGGIGTALVPALEQAGYEVTATDLHNMDVRSEKFVSTQINRCRPHVIFHLAGRKLAVEGELDPVEFARTNILGTANLAKACRGSGPPRIVFASTCKAADPETAYGASKLICERIVLNSGGTVVRFFNILASGPSVLDIWQETPLGEPLPVTDCYRYFITIDQGVQALIQAAGFPPGRYAPDPGPPRHMSDVATELFPGRDLRMILRRRGDRHREPLHANCETIARKADGLLQIVGPHDPPGVGAAKAWYEHAYA